MGSEFKPFGELFEPDSRSTTWARFDPTKREIINITLETLYAAVEAQTLSDLVPRDVTFLYDNARNLMVYSWFCYRFGVMAEHFAIVSVEYALKKRLGEPQESRKGLKRLLADAKEKGLLKKEAFFQYQYLEDLRKNREKENTEMQKNFGLEFKKWAPMNNESFLEQKIDFLTYFRNHFAHGSASIWKGSTATLQTCRDLIDQLWA